MSLSLSMPGEGRVPPHDLEAEASVLGAILLDQTALSRVLEILQPEDFYRENNAQIYRAGIELFRDGEPIDLVTLADQLQKQGVLERVGGRAHLATLVEQTPTAANVEYYGRIVKGHSYKRALISAGGEVTALGYNDALEAEEALNTAQARVFSIAEQRTGSGMERIYDLLKPAMDRIDAQMASGGGVVGVPSGFHELDRITNGFKASDMIVIAGRPSMGKALALDTRIPTPAGWTTMGELDVGDLVLDEEGEACRVTYATPVQLERDCYRVAFSDGTSVVADADHLWTTSAEPERGRTPRFRVVSTRQVLATLRTPTGAPAHHLPVGAVSAHPVASGARVGPGCAETALWIERVEPVPSVPVRCIQVDSPTRLYLAGPGRVPTHNTSFVLNMTLHAAIEHKVPVAIFSLEMSKEQLVERMLCEQARIDAQRLHRGMLSEREHEQLVYSLGPLGDAPVFIDDTPMLDDLTLRLKARQASARDNVGMIIVDYLQLMHGRSSTNDANRVQEVSQISRSMKAIARELRVPIIAISQLSRAPEQRPDKRPVLSDLRESGCMPAATRLLRADDNREVTLGELLLSQEQPLVWSVDDRWRLVPRRLLRTFPSGIRPTFRLRLASGAEVEATGNHQFRTVQGWKALDELRPGIAIAVPRTLPDPTEGCRRWDPDELILLAHLLGDGSLGPGIKYATADPENRQAVIDAAARRFEVAVEGSRLGNTWQLWLKSPLPLTRERRHPVAEWLDGLGLWMKRSHDKFIPEELHELDADQMALFLRHLWATDGSITLGRNGRGRVLRIYYASGSRRLVDGVRRMLLRLDIRSRVRPSRKAGYRDLWTLDVTGARDQTRFLNVVGCEGVRGRLIPECLDVLAAAKPNPNVDLVPWEMVGEVKAAMVLAGMNTRAVATGLGEGYSGAYVLGSEGRPPRYSRNRLEAMATIVASRELRDLATSDVFWDEVVQITPLGEQPVFDATVEDTHNFVANGIVAHNSIEQDADLVMFLYRDDYYNREKSEKPGLADVIIAKHRNGPTGNIELRFIRELTRFENIDRRHTDFDIEQ